MLKQAKGWQQSELERINASGMDIARIQGYLANINSSIATVHNPVDLKKMRDLKNFFEQELRKRGHKHNS